MPLAKQKHCTPLEALIRIQAARPNEDPVSNLIAVMHDGSLSAVLTLDQSGRKVPFPVAALDRFVTRVWQKPKPKPNSKENLPSESEKPQRQEPTPTLADRIGLTKYEACTKRIGGLATFHGASFEGDKIARPLGGARFNGIPADDTDEGRWLDMARGESLKAEAVWGLGEELLEAHRTGEATVGAFPFQLG